MHTPSPLSLSCLCFISLFSLGTSVISVSSFFYVSYTTPYPFCIEQSLSYSLIITLLSDISSLCSHVYSLVQLSYVFLVLSLTQTARLALESHLPSKLEARQYPLLVSWALTFYLGLEL